jgi:hypothetical protein
MNVDNIQTSRTSKRSNQNLYRSGGENSTPFTNAVTRRPSQSKSGEENSTPFTSAVVRKRNPSRNGEENSMPSISAPRIPEILRERD